MIYFRNFFAAAVLTFVLAGATLADDGIIYGGVAPTPVPTPVAPASNSGSLNPPPAAAPSGEEVTPTDIAIASLLNLLGRMSLLY
ncbi:MAG TPA: hypothetical protein VM936_02210 [Pyrinomonadaceae bacterium]|jgi:hypothetical protein|nr:hypothetical protein [Pyrinomonadaceae bacterium]